MLKSKAREKCATKKCGRAGIVFSVGTFWFPIPHGRPLYPRRETRNLRSGCVSRPRKVNVKFFGTYYALSSQLVTAQIYNEALFDQLGPRIV